MLTLLELVDLYSALSHRAPLKWKASVCFCVYDYDEDGYLDLGDLYRVVTQILLGTRHEPTETDAAIKIQKVMRGKKAREAHAMKGLKQFRVKKTHHANHSKGPIRSYCAQILEKSTSVKQDVIDSRYFENQMNTFPLFRENFCVTPTTHKALARATKLEAKVRAAHPDQRAAFTSCLTFACLRVNSLRPLSCE